MSLPSLSASALKARAARLAACFGAASARLAGDARAVSAVEFALILPVMCTLFFASVETTQGLQADRKVSLAARALSDLASQATSIADADMTNILNATATVLSPFPVSNATVVVTGIQIDAQGKATVAWSDTLGGTRYACGATMTVPSQLMPAAGTTSFLVLAEVKYAYTPTIGYMISGTLTLSDKLYTRPRSGDQITRTPKQGSLCI